MTRRFRFMIYGTMSCYILVFSLWLWSDLVRGMDSPSTVTAAKAFNVHAARTHSGRVLVGTSPSWISANDMDKSCRLTEQTHHHLGSHLNSAPNGASEARIDCGIQRLINSIRGQNIRGDALAERLEIARARQILDLPVTKASEDAMTMSNTHPPACREFKRGGSLLEKILLAARQDNVLCSNAEPPLVTDHHCDFASNHLLTQQDHRLEMKIQEETEAEKRITKLREMLHQRAMQHRQEMWRKEQEVTRLDLELQRSDRQARMHEQSQIRDMPISTCCCARISVVQMHNLLTMIVKAACSGDPCGTRTVGYGRAGAGPSRGAAALGPRGKCGDASRS